MTDLKNMTPDDLMAGLDSDVHFGERAEIRRRLEELEREKAKVEQLVGDVHAITADYTDATERLKKCEAALRLLMRVCGMHKLGVFISEAIMDQEMTLDEALQIVDAVADLSEYERLQRRIAEIEAQPNKTGLDILALIVGKGLLDDAARAAMESK